MIIFAALTRARGGRAGRSSGIGRGCAEQTDRLEPAEVVQLSPIAPWTEQWATVRTVIVPVHSRELPRWLLKKIIKDAGLSEDEFRKLL